MNSFADLGVEPVARTDRNGVDESLHFGAVVGLGASGEVELVVGDQDLAIFARSSNKPLQAVAMLHDGLRVDSRQLAVVCSSHSGTVGHLAVVRSILAEHGLEERDLRNTADLPLDVTAAYDVIRSGGSQTPLLMNCSGKHAGMLATCVARRWDLASYLEPDHPLQQRIGATIDELGGVAHLHVGVDGCGAPAHVTTLTALARAYRRLALARVGSHERAAVDAMRAHPSEVGGPGRDVTVLMQRIPGLVAKDGADGVYAGAMPDGRAVAIKIADGGGRARPAVFAAALALLGVDVSGAREAWDLPVLGHGRPVGRVRAVGAFDGVLERLHA